MSETNEEVLEKWIGNHQNKGIVLHFQLSKISKYPTDFATKSAVRTLREALTHKEDVVCTCLDGDVFLCLVGAEARATSIARIIADIRILFADDPLACGVQGEAYDLERFCITINCPDSLAMRYWKQPVTCMHMRKTN